MPDPSPGWEFCVAMWDDGDRWPDIEIHVDEEAARGMVERLRNAFDYDHVEVQRRRKAGPWEPVPDA